MQKKSDFNYCIETPKIEEKAIYWYSGKLINSQTIELELNNPGLLYGATVFTTLRVYNNSLDSRLTYWLSHLERIKTSLIFFGWQQPNWELIRQGAEVMKQQFPVLRITIFPDGTEWITGRNLPTDINELQKHGIAASLAGSEFYRSLPNHKTGNYLTAWLAKTHAQNLDTQEAILTDAQGNWLETTTGNLWGWKDDSCLTHPLNAGILPGIVRSHLKTFLIFQQYPVYQEPWTKELVESFRAIAYSNCVVETVPIHTVIDPVRQLEYNSHHICLDQLRIFFQ